MVSWLCLRASERTNVHLFDTFKDTHKVEEYHSKPIHTQQKKVEEFQMVYELDRIFDCFLQDKNFRVVFRQ